MSVEERKRKGTWRYEQGELGDQVSQQEFPKELLRDIEKSARYWHEGDMVALLKEHEVPVNVVNSDGQGPLIWATQEGNLDLVFELLKLGADPNHVDCFGSSALTYACNRGSSKFQIARVLWKRTSENLRDKVRDRIAEEDWGFDD